MRILVQCAKALLTKTFSEGHTRIIRPWMSSSFSRDKISNGESVSVIVCKESEHSESVSLWVFMCTVYSAVHTLPDRIHFFPREPENTCKLYIYIYIAVCISYIQSTLLIHMWISQTSRHSTESERELNGEHGTNQRVREKSKESAKASNIRLSIFLLP